MVSAISADVVRQACLDASDILSGIGYTGPKGSIHLLQLKLQSNTVTSILHNMIGWQLAEHDKRWTFRPKGGGTPDLETSDRSESLQIKVTSDGQVKANRISRNEGKFLIVKYSRIEYRIQIDNVLMGELHDEDWIRPENTQFAILKPEAETRLPCVYSRS